MRVLFITSTRIGDAVLSTGVLKTLVDQYPAAHFTIACGPLAAPLFAAVPGLERIIVMRKERYDLHWLRLWNQVRGIVWDDVIDLRRSLVSFVLRARKRHVLAKPDPTRHRVEILADVLGIDHPLDPYVFTTTAHKAAAARAIPDGPPVIGVGPVASTAAKTWPLEHFADLLARVTAPGGLCAGWRVAGFGGPGDETSVKNVLAAVPPERRLEMVAEPDLLLVHEALARCRMFVGNDSGLAHLSAAAGTPTLALFGATDTVGYRPWGGDFLRSPEPSDLRALKVESVAMALETLRNRAPAAP